MRLDLEGGSVVAQGRRLLGHTDLHLASGEVCALVGPNGAGKSTLLRAALGLQALSSGSVRLDGRPLRELSLRERAAALGWLPQHPVIREGVTAHQLVAAARYRFDESHGARQRAALAALHAVGVGELARRRVPTLSGGEAQRVALAALDAQQAELLLLDEPANHLDPAVQGQVYKQLETWRAGGRGLLVVTHDINLLRAFHGSVTVLGLAKGETRFRLPLEAPELPEAMSRLFEVHFEAVRVQGHRVLVTTGAPL